MRYRNCSQMRGVYVDSDGARASDVANLPFVIGLARMCDEGWRHGWHERNGGNASYRLTEQERADVRSCLGAGVRAAGFTAIAQEEAAHLDEAAWVSLCLEAPGLAGEWLLVTAAGSYMQNVAPYPEKCLGIIELDDRGSAYRVIWGFEGGGRPTSEVSAHVLIHARKKEATDGAFRVLYHCHPVPVIAMTHVLGADARAITRLLWKMMTECVMVFPQGIGVVPCEVPGSMELANMTASAVKDYDAVIWAQHGLLATGENFDAAFGLIHVVVKAAQIFESACTMAGGPDHVAGIPDEELPRLAEGLGVSLNPRYL